MSAATVAVRVEVPSGPYNEYRFDSHQEAMRLSYVVYPERELPADLCAALGTLGDDGHPLRVLLLVSRPTMAGAIVEARLIGALELPGGLATLVGVPLVDSALADLDDVALLSDADLSSLKDLAREPASDERPATGTPRWRGPEVAREVLRQGQVAARLAIAANRKVGGSPAWQVPDPRLRSARREGEGDAYSAAEYSVMDLPPRFQRHVAECLLDDERILHFVSRPEMSLDSRLSLRRPRKLNDGVLILTDRQVLWMTDALPPDSTLVDWGYLATSSPVERATAVHLDASGVHLRLEIGFSARGGASSHAVEFPRAAEPAIRHFARLLSRFIPGQRIRALQRIYEVKPSPADLSVAAEMVERGVLLRLQSGVEDALPGEEVFTRALAPARSDGRRGPALLVATRDRVLLVEDRRGQGRVLSSADLEEVSSVELRYSILGSRLKLTIPKNGLRVGREDNARDPRVDELELESESPGAFGPMLQTFRCLLPLLANPRRPA